MNEGFTPLEGDKDSACLILLYLRLLDTGGAALEFMLFGVKKGGVWGFGLHLPLPLSLGED